MARKAKASKSRKTKKKTAKKATTKKAAVKKATAKKAKARAKVKKAAKAKKPAVKMVDSKPQVTVGQAIPDVVLPATGGRTIALSELRGKNVVLYFYPKDSTPGCTIEGHDFTRLHDEFKSANTEVFGISRDSIRSHENFKAKQNYSVDLLSDEDEKASQLFGVIKMKNMYGKKVRGIERSTFVIDRDGRLVKEWRKVSVPGHAEEVLNFVKTLS